MVYADTDFFLALLKENDWLKASAKALLKRYRGQIWTSPAGLTELLVLATRLRLDPEALLMAVLGIAQLKGGEASVYLLAAHYMKAKEATALDALHAAFCGSETIISSDKIFDKLGLKRIPLGAA